MACSASAHVNPVVRRGSNARRPTFTPEAATITTNRWNVSRGDRVGIHFHGRTKAEFCRAARSHDAEIYCRPLLPSDGKGRPRTWRCRDPFDVSRFFPVYGSSAGFRKLGRRREYVEIAAEGADAEAAVDALADVLTGGRRLSPRTVAVVAAETREARTDWTSSRLRATWRRVPSYGVERA